MALLKKKKLKSHDLNTWLKAGASAEVFGALCTGENCSQGFCFALPLKLFLYLPSTGVVQSQVHLCALAKTRDRAAVMKKPLEQCVLAKTINQGYYCIAKPFQHCVLAKTTPKAVFSQSLCCSYAFCTGQNWPKLPVFCKAFAAGHVYFSKLGNRAAVLQSLWILVYSA